MHFFKRIAYKKERASALTATARKLAVIIWNIIIKQEKYKPMYDKEYNFSLNKKP